MENAVNAGHDGTVTEIRVAAGDSVGARRRRGGDRVRPTAVRRRRPSKGRARDVLERAEPTWSRCSHAIHARPELGFEEDDAAERWPTSSRSAAWR